MSAVYYPTSALIESVMKGVQTVITFTDDHDFTDGEIVSFRVSPPYGMVELNNKQAKVVSHTSDTITVDIQSSNFTTFVTPDPEDIVSVAMTVPSASGIVPNLYTPTMNLEDAFDHIRT